jgi:hypothetical protein
MIGQVCVVVLVIMVMTGLRYKVGILRMMVMGNKLVAEQKCNSYEEQYFRQDCLHIANI